MRAPGLRWRRNICESRKFVTCDQINFCDEEDVRELNLLDQQVYDRAFVFAGEPRLSVFQFVFAAPVV